MEIQKTFGRYEIIRFLGSGATSEVYLARDTKLEREVALKILKPALVSDQESFIRFTKEAKLAGQLFHDHIATVFDMGDEMGRYYIAMQFIDGMAMNDYIEEKGALPWEEVRKIAAEIGDALAYAHSKGFVHRDIKPNNIIVTKDKHVVLTDFGLTRAMLQSGLTTTSGAVLGTPPYIPPEVWNGQGASFASDQYSLACVIDEALTGVPRFSGETPQEIITKHLITPPLFESYPVNVPENVRAIMQKALNKKPSDRFESIDAFVAALQNPASFVAEPVPPKPVPVKPASAPQAQKSAAATQPPARLKRKPARFIIPIFLVLIFICGGGFILVRQYLGGGFASFLSAQDSPEQQGIASAYEETQPTSGYLPEQARTELPEDSSYEVEQPTSGNLPEQQVTEQPEESAATLPAEATEKVPAPEIDYGELVGSGVSITQSDYNGASLVVHLYFGDGSPVDGQYVAVYSQQKDLSGNWVTDSRLAKGYTDNSGKIGFNLEPGAYIVSSEISGYLWGTSKELYGQVDVPVEGGKTTQLVLNLNTFTVGILKADGTVLEDMYVALYTQKTDIAGNFVSANKIKTGYTDNGGTVTFHVTPGYYIVYCDLLGYNWGSVYDGKGEANIPLPPGEESQLTIRLGQMIVGLQDANGKPLVDQYVVLYTQTTDVAGNATYDSKIKSTYTDNTGSITFNLTPGHYALKIDDQFYYNIEVRAGAITQTDGINTQIQ